VEEEELQATVPGAAPATTPGTSIPGTILNPDGSISRGVLPAPEVETAAPTPPGPQLNIDPVVFDKPTLDTFTRMFQNAPGGPAAIIAKELAAEAARDNGEFLSYESLRNGTARIFDLNPNLRDLPPARRSLSNEQIISLLAVDTEGNPIEAGTFGAGAAREALPQAGGFAGFMAGARALGSLPIPNPLGRAGAGLVGGVIGALAGYEGGEALTDELLGPERPLLPGQTTAYEQGKTAAGVLAWLPLPLRLAQGIENALGRMGASAREAPIGTVVVESVAGAGTVLGAGIAEENFPGQAGPRIGLELGFGTAFGAASQPFPALVAGAGDIRGIFRNVRERGLTAALSPVHGARQRQAVNRILDILESEGEDVNAVIDRLASNDLSNLLVDDAGRPIPLTAGAKSGSPALLAIEASLEQLGSALGRDRTSGSEAAIKALRNVILAMAQTGDQAALQQAADLAENVFSAQLNENLTRATENVLAAYQQVGGTLTGTNVQLSESLYDVVQTQMGLARAKERMLWRNVPNIVAATAADAAADTPAFIREWNALTGGTEEYAADIKAALPRINQFVNRKTRELGLDGTAAADGDGAADAADLGELTTRELTDMRSMALELGRELNAAGSDNKARIAYAMADAMLEDLQNARAEGDDWRIAYDMARAYSRSLNDTFTRAFAGDVLATDKSGATRIAPELLASRLLQAGNDATYLRTLQINEIGDFAAREGLEGAQETIGTLRGTTEQILRNARAAAFNPETGQINPVALARWVEQNEDVLNAFTDLRDDLLDAQKANLLLNETSIANQRAQAEMMAQLSFYDLMNPVISENGRRMFGTESPTTAIARALSSSNRTPVRSLNNLLEVVENAPDDLRDQAMTGLRSSILEWAATKAGGSMSGTFSPSTLYDSMFKPMPGSQNRISLTEWMLDKGVISQMEVDNLRTYLSEMVKFEAGAASGTLEGLAATAGPILQFYSSITGSVIGTTAQRAISGGSSGPGALAAAGAGKRFMDEITQRIPAALRSDVMAEMMRNPELLAAMMRRPRNERESMRLAQRLQQLLIDGGFIPPVRRTAPGAVRETSRDRFVPPPVPAAPPAPAPDTRPAIPSNQQGSSVPPARPPTPGGGAAPAPNQRAAAPPAPTPTPSGPVDRARFAAFFPNDPTADLIRQQASGGIGGLMGG
jgi:hypothetical protein